jgi:HD-GYP domain-containing protein (c-di-GMP phosphodiesterase class II)
MEDTHNIVKVLNEEKEFDEYTYTHSINVGIYSMLIGRWMKLGQDEIHNLMIAGLLHDVGKTKIPYNVLNKTGKLTDKEFELLKNHPEFGYDILLEQRALSEDICQAVLLHHERIDGSGYPYHIRGDEIGLYAKIVAIADVYDAITTNRVYKSKRTPFEAFKIFMTEEVKNLDPLIVHTFITNISTHYVGMKVLLNTGEVGKIVYIPPQSVSNPIVDLNHDYIDLSVNQDKNIVKVV